MYYMCETCILQVFFLHIYYMCVDYMYNTPKTPHIYYMCATFGSGRVSEARFLQFPISVPEWQIFS